MKERTQLRLSFANVASMLALVVALGGSAYAAATIDGRTIKVNSIPGNRIKKRSLTGKQINAAKVPALERRVQWAFVDNNGHIVAQSGKITISHHFVGADYLGFGSSVLHKAIIVTPSLSYGDLHHQESAAVCGGAGSTTPSTTPGGAVACVAGAQDNNHVFVSSATASGSPANEAYYIAVIG